MNFETFNIPVSKIGIENISAESQKIISQKSFASVIFNADI